MKLTDLKKLVEKWLKWSAEKQLKVFLRNKETTKFFKEAINSKWLK